MMDMLKHTVQERKEEVIEINTTGFKPSLRSSHDQPVLSCNDQTGSTNLYQVYVILEFIDFCKYLGGDPNPIMSGNS